MEEFTEDEMNVLLLTVSKKFTDSVAGGSVMICAAMSHIGKTNLVHINNNLAAQRYCDENSATTCPSNYA